MRKARAGYTVASDCLIRASDIRFVGSRTGADGHMGTVELVGYV
jgi:hypothetical protein